MRKVKKPVFFIVFAVIVLFAVSVITGLRTQYGDIVTTHIKGINDIRWGIDIRGGVDVSFTPPEGFDATDEQMDSAKEVIVQRMVKLGITDSECYVDYNKDKIIVRFPWKEGEADFDPEQAVKELGETAMLTFREGNSKDENGAPAGETKDKIVLEGKDIESATPVVIDGQYAVSLKLTGDGVDKFAEATGRLTGKIISIWMDDTCISEPKVESKISDGSAIINGNFDRDSVKSLADKINSGALPFKLVTANFSTVNPTLGMGARDAMGVSGIIALTLIAIFLIAYYRLPGFIAVIAIVGQVAGSLAAVSGYFGFMNSFTLTIPGIAGIILSIGMGVDANIITSERIKEGVRSGKTIDGALEYGFDRAFSAILDGNVTTMLIAIVLMGAFGPPDSMFAKLLNPVFFMFGPSTAGTIYSFGYTLLVGVILNFIMGVGASRLMLASISKFKPLRNPVLYGGVKNEK